jgi:hypothetical protein
MTSNEKTERIFYTKRQRLRRALFWVVASAILAIFPTYQMGSLEAIWLGEKFWFIAVGGLIFFPAFVIYMVRSGVKLSREEAKATLAFTFDYPPTAALEKVNIADGPFEGADTNTMETFGWFINNLWVRYPIAALCFGIAFLLPNTIDVPLRIAIGLILVCLGLYLAREVMVWAAGLALVGLVIWGLFAGLAALTVPAAIIVGALIIAFAIRR